MKAWLAIPLCVLVACSSPTEAYDGSSSGAVGLDDGMLAFSASSVVDTQGVHLPDERPWSVAGMSGMTCQVHMDDGHTGTDIDVAPMKENIVDGIAGTVLVEGETGFQVVDFPEGAFGDSWTLAPGGQSRLLVDGHADLAYRDGTCQLDFHGAEFASVELPSEYCGGAMVASNDGVAWVGSGASLARVTPAGFSVLPIGGQELAIDRTSGLVLAGAVGSDELMAVLPDGTDAWTVAFEHPIAGFDAASGFVVVSLGGSREGSDLRVLDAATGEELSRQHARSIRPGRVTASTDFVAVDSGTRLDFLRF